MAETKSPLLLSSMLKEANVKMQSWNPYNSFDGNPDGTADFKSTVLGYSHGYLIIRHSWRTRQPILWDPFKKVQRFRFRIYRPFPNFSRYPSATRCILTAPLPDPECRLVLFDPSQGFHCCSARPKSAWSSQPLLDPDDNDVRHLALFKRRVYALTGRGHLLCLDFSSAAGGLHLDKLPNRIPEGDNSSAAAGTGMHLVQSGGHLLFIHYAFPDPRDNNGALPWLNIYRHSPIQWGWVKLHHLGGRTIFLDHRGGCTSSHPSPDRKDYICFAGPDQDSTSTYSLDGKLQQATNTNQLTPPSTAIITCPPPQPSTQWPREMWAKPKDWYLYSAD